jgi:hypothetical protein
MGDSARYHSLKSPVLAYEPPFAREFRNVVKQEIGKAGFDRHQHTDKFL